LGTRLAKLEYEGDVDAGQVYYYHEDVLGSTVMVTDFDGQVTWRGDCAPFGETLAEQTSWGNAYTYLGNEDDGGVRDFGARFYDARVGRFISPDPVKNVASANVVNPYTYCANNPLKYTDRFGLSTNPVYPEPSPEDGKRGGGGGGTDAGRPNDPESLWQDFGETDQYIAFDEDVPRTQRDDIVALLEDFWGVNVTEVPWATRGQHASEAVSNCDLLIQFFGEGNWPKDAPNQISYAHDNIRWEFGTYDEIFVNYPVVAGELTPLALGQGESWRTDQPGYLGARRGGGILNNKYWWANQDPARYDGFFDNAIAKIGSYFVVHELSHLITGIDDDLTLMVYSPIYAGYSEYPIGILFYYTTAGERHMANNRYWDGLKDRFP